MCDHRQVSVQDVLAARDRRAQRQQEMRLRHGAPLISFTMNIAGPVKDNAAIRRAFWAGAERVENELKRLRACVLERREHIAFTGCEMLWSVSCPAQTLKTSMCCLEEMDELGRLFDLDVVDTDGRQLKRERERTCLVCGGPVHLCARSRAHSAEMLFEKALDIIRRHFEGIFVQRVGELAQRALLTEAITTPKPGLVDCENSGAHRDMALPQFVNSACALRPYFEDCVRMGLQQLGPDALQRRGLQAEHEMQSAAGVNTHKGAIFALGILCYAAGRHGEGADTEKLCAAAAELGSWYLAKIKENNPMETGGEKQLAAYGLPGARGTAADGFQVVRTYALPAFRKALALGKSLNDAGVCALLTLISRVQDSNILRRGGKHALDFAMAEVEKLTAQDGGNLAVRALNDVFVEKNISPGGSADLLAVTYFLYWMEEAFAQGRME